MFDYTGLIRTQPHPLHGLDLGNAIGRGVYKSLEAISRTRHHHGETNRYYKVSIALSDGPPIEKPSILENLQYQRHQYSPIYHDELQATSTAAAERPIRLLELLPPENTDDIVIRCKLHAFSLENAPDYETISYTWGLENTQNFPVVVVSGDAVEYKEKSGKPEAVQITRHLYAALLRLRSSGECRYLWADQICINQIDKKEKGKQVRQMGDIYKRSIRTVIWLGEEDGDKEVIQEIFTMLREQPFKSVGNDISLFQKLLDLEELPSAGSSNMTRGQWRRQAVTRLLNRTWFSRVWVFQESVVSADVKVVCGSIEFPLSDLFRITSAVFALEDAAGGYFRSIAKRTVGFDTLFLIQHNRKGGCESDYCPRKKMPSNFLGLVMQALQQLHATKELDLIYAFVGFESPDPSPKIEIDYNLPVSTAWINASRVMIQNSGSLDIFAAVRGDEKCKYDLPSWVPDFSKCYPHARPISAPDFITNFQASEGLPHTWKDADHPETLIVKGKLVSKIEWLSPLSFDHKSSREEGTGTEAVLDFENHAAAMERYLSLNDAVSPQKEHELLGGYSKIIRTMLADGAFGHEQPLQHSIEDIIRVCKKEQSIQKGTEDYNILEKLRQWGLIVQQKQLFLSDNYDMGLVPKTAHRGDLICLLHGSKVPCVLRRNEASEGNYRIISQCYLDGMMYGDGSPETMAGLKEEATEFALV